MWARGPADILLRSAARPLVSDGLLPMSPAFNASSVSRAVLLALGLASAQPARAAGTTRLSFNEDIQPILSEHCFHCHGPDATSRKGKLRLDRAEFAFLPREAGPVLVKGDPVASQVMERVLATDPEDVMPPEEAHKPLSKEKIALLRRWIAEGAEYQEHWAFVKPVRETAPPVKDATWPRGPLDRWILAGLERAGLTGGPEADRHALLRRVSFDLTGLPPTPAEIGDFLADSSPQAYARVVDRLLASPRFGEHRARYWLDAVRYGDTNGEHADNLRNAWPYRDYVIRAFNANKRFDAFVLEQVAGDLLPPTTLDQLVASQFNRLNTTTNEGGSIVEEIHQNKIKDRTQTFGSVFLGLTMGCAACHDHKYDPLTKRDYYSLSAFFNNMPDSAYDANQPAVFPTVSVPAEERRAEAERILAGKAEVQRQWLARQARATELLEAWIDGGARTSLQPVATTGLQAHFRFDEGKGDVVHNRAPGAVTTDYPLGGRDHSWGGSTRPVNFWTGLRFGVQTALKAGELGDFERDQAFTVGGWFLPRERSGTNTGSFVSRLSVAEGKRGWDLFWQAAPTRRAAPAKANRKAAGRESAAETVAKKAAQEVAEDDESRPEPEGYLVANLIHREKTNAISVRTKRAISRKEWVHLAFSYDGSGRAEGVSLYIDGQPQDVEVLANTLTDSIRTSAPWQLARRTGGDASPETSFQDLRLYARALTADEVRRMSHEDVVTGILPKPIASWTADERKIVEDFYFRNVDREAIALRAEIARRETDFQRATAGGVVTMIARERESRPAAFVLDRGAFDAVTERVEANVPAVLPPLPEGGTHDRLALARWLVSRENPLLARVTVNRMWQELFGRGLVETPENFGVNGARPSNRKLLDWLALEFEESGWDVKRIYRTMVMSATYRQSARTTPDRLARDPENKLLSRGPRFRLDGEMLRDQALLASGLLVERTGGPSVRPYQAEGVWEAVAVVGQSNTKDYVPDRGEGLYRRSVYTFWKRIAPNPVLTTFDAPKRDVCTLLRDRTNTPLQALVTENATDYLEAARVLATRTLHLPDAGPAQRLDAMALSLLGRPLAAPERQTLVRSLEKFRDHFARDDDARAFLSVGESPVDAALPATELAAWTLAASQLINSDAALNK